MIKKIICPTDFSPASENAVNYAAGICQVLGTSLELITIESIYTSGMMILPMDIQEKTLTTAEMMEYVCDNIKTSFQIPCDFEIFISHHSIARTLKQNKTGDYLVVMGTSAKQSFVKHWIGSVTYRFIKKTNYPLLMIPEHVSYQGIKRLVIASKDELKLSSSPLDIIKEKFQPLITILQVYPSNTSFKENKNATAEKSIKTETIHIKEELFSRNTFKSIHAYMIHTQADLLVVVDKRRGFLNNLFHASVIKKLSRQDLYPVLIIKNHEDMQLYR